ncbi:MAG: metallophosphoesterase [Actinobacteria bacterium]|nr:MAG: metallophosphoesterase [Actinomycetota bacterium]
MRIAAIGDIHSGDRPRPHIMRRLAELEGLADILLLCGDLTRYGRVSQAETLLAELSELTMPTFGVLGNHDYHHGEQEAIADRLNEGGMTILDGDGVTVTLGGEQIGIAGAKGFAGGFGIRAIPDFGEPILREMYREMIAEAGKLEHGLRMLQTKVKVAMLHYAPIVGTLQGEDQQIWPFLGTSYLADVVDGNGATVVFHGHSHYGVERGITPGGVPVRNVSMPLLKQHYVIYELQT